MLINYLLLHLLLLEPQYIPLLAHIRHLSPLHALSVNDLVTPRPNVFGMDRDNVHIVKKSVTPSILVLFIDATANALIHIYFIV